MNVAEGEKKKRDALLGESIGYSCLCLLEFGTFLW